MKKKFNKIELYRFARYGYRVDKALEKFFKASFFLSLIMFAGTLEYQYFDPGLYAFTKEASKVNSYALEDYTAFYFKDLERNGFNVDSIMSKQKSADMRFKYIRAIGVANGMFDKNVINIEMNPYYWKKLTPAERMFVVYHEYGHDMHFLWHKENWIMSPSKRSTGKITWKKLYELREEYFEDIRNNKKDPDDYWWYRFKHLDCKI